MGRSVGRQMRSVIVLRRTLILLVMVISCSLWISIGLADLDPKLQQMIDDKEKFPQLAQETVPSGTTVVSHTYARDHEKVTRNVSIGYIATSPNPNDILHLETTYQLECKIFDTNSATGKSLIKYYPAQQEQELKSLMNVKNEVGHQRTAQESSYSWGKIVTIRDIYTPIGVGGAKPKTYYDVFIKGRINSVLFDASVTGLPNDKSKADAWVNRVAGELTKWSLSNMAI